VKNYRFHRVNHASVQYHDVQVFSDIGSFVVRRAMRWVQNISQKKDDQRSMTTPATFIEGGTIGPPAPMTTR
jgi:hypothetical protein